MTPQEQPVEMELTSKTYNLETLPAYRRPVVEELIIATEVFADGMDTPENLDGVAKRIFDVIVEQHLLDAHLRANLLPESHD